MGRVLEMISLCGQSEPLCQWLAGLALLEAKEYSDALLILTGEDEQFGLSRSVSVSNNTTFLSTPHITSQNILEGFTSRSVSISVLIFCFYCIVVGWANYTSCFNTNRTKTTCVFDYNSERMLTNSKTSTMRNSSLANIRVK